MTMVETEQLVWLPTHFPNFVKSSLPRKKIALTSNSQGIFLLDRLEKRVQFLCFASLPSIFI